MTIFLPGLQNMHFYNLLAMATTSAVVLIYFISRTELKKSKVRVKIKK